VSILQAIILGVIQGLTEFLPISSSAHLFLAVVLFGWSGDGFGAPFDVSLHVGTLLAVLWYFRKDWTELCLAALDVVRYRRVSGPLEMRAVLLVVAVIPAVIGGLLLNDLVSNQLRTPGVTAGALILLGLVLWVVDARAPSKRSLDAMQPRDAIVIGLAQVAALVPGVSRSGATMTAGRFLAFDRAAAARFSFLLSMPVIAGAAVIRVPEAIAQQGLSPQLLVGTAASAITGWFAIHYLLRFLARHGFAVFAVYRIILGISVYVILYARN
jgi:undecaprenyl-diphosphatase